MDGKPVSLKLGEMIFEMLRGSGATQLEQLCAIDVARALVPVSGSSLTSSDSYEPHPEWRSPRFGDER